MPPVVPPVIPPITPSPGGGSSGPGGPGGGSSPIIRTIDTCLGGDYSGNYYDGICSVGVPSIPNKDNPSETPLVIVDSTTIGNILQSFSTHMESKNSNFVDASMDQQIYKTAIKLWREIIKNKEVKVDTALTILE